MTYNFSGRIETIKEVLATQGLPKSDWQNVFNWDYWTEAQLSSFSPYYLFTLTLIFLVLLVLWWWRRSVKILHQIAPVYEKVLGAILNAIIFIIIMTFTYLFFRYQEISNLSSRLVILASILVTLGYIAYAAVLQWRVLPSQRRQYLEKEQYFRYLPKKKERH